VLAEMVDLLHYQQLQLQEVVADTFQQVVLADLVVEEMVQIQVAQRLHLVKVIQAVTEMKL
jgi:hypothetical protein